MNPKFINTAAANGTIERKPHVILLKNSDVITQIINIENDILKTDDSITKKIRSLITTAIPVTDTFFTSLICLQSIQFLLRKI